MLWLVLASAFAQSDCVQTTEYRAKRPNLSGPEETVASDDGRFLLHFTREGEDKPNGGIGADGLPNMVTRVLEGLEMGATAFAKRGYRTFRQDDGKEGSDAVDVYLTDIDANGYANVANGADGETSCFIRINSSLGSLGGEIVESVTMHELHHCVQFGYTADTHSFLYEATATYEQYLAFSDEALELALNVLYVDRIQNPQRALNDISGRYHYAGFLFLKFWTEFGGTDDGRVPALWEWLSVEPRWDDALRSESRRVWDLNFDALFLEYSEYNAFACARDDGQHYEAATLACRANVEVPFQTVSSAEGSVAVTLNDPKYSAEYARWDRATEGLLSQLTCSAPTDSTAELRVALLHVDGDGRAQDREQMRVETEGSSITLSEPNGLSGTTLAVFVSTGKGPVSATCVLTEIEPAPDGCGCATPGSAQFGWSLLPCLLLFRRRR